MNRKFKKLITFICALALTINLQAQEKRDFNHIQNGTVVKKIDVSEIDSITFEIYTGPGILINGVVWAPCNVDLPGTFTEHPYEVGLLYQWNRSLGWSLTDPMVNHQGGTTWDPSYPEGTTWTNNVCPQGWRVPTYAELERLTDSDSFLGELNGIKGRFFGNGAQKVFIPVSNARNYTDGTFFGFQSDAFGYSWSSSSYTAEGAWYLGFDLIPEAMLVGIYAGYRSYAFPVRCVLE